MTMRSAVIRPLLALLVAALFLPCAAWAEAERTWHWDDVPKVVAFGDVHGAYDPLVAMLTDIGIIDEQQTWAGGQAHLVIGILQQVR